MSNAEAIEAARQGRRAATHHSRHAEEDRALSATCPHPHWRTVACDGDTDVIECNRCGRQRLAACDFDEDYD